MSKHSKYFEDGKKYIQIATNDTTLLVLKINMQKYLREIGYTFSMFMNYCRQRGLKN